MTSLWVAVLILTVIVLLNAVATIALTHQIGLLHVRLAPLRAMQGEGGPPPGAALSLIHPEWDGLKARRLDRIIVGFVSPTCRICGPLLPTFNHVFKGGLEAGEGMILVADANEDRTAEYARAKSVAAPMIPATDALQKNSIPGVPFIVITDGAGSVVTSGVVNTGEQVDWIIDQARDAASSASSRLGDQVLSVEKVNR